jgi:hypothetical protein
MKIGYKGWVKDGGWILRLIISVGRGEGVGTSW